MIRFPKARCPREEAAYAEPIRPGRGEFVRRSGADTLLVAMGGLVSLAAEASDLLLREQRLAAPGGAAGTAGGADVYALRFIVPFDEEAFLEAAAPYRSIIVLEEGVVAGGLGEGIASLASRRLPRASVRAVGFAAEPEAQASRDELIDRSGLSAQGIAARVRAAEAEDRAEGRIYVFRSASPGGAIGARA